jgi:hypothetical protein
VGATRKEKENNLVIREPHLVWLCGRDLLIISGNTARQLAPHCGNGFKSFHDVETEVKRCLSETDKEQKDLFHDMISVSVFSETKSKSSGMAVE